MKVLKQVEDGKMEVQAMADRGAGGSGMTGEV